MTIGEMVVDGLKRLVAAGIVVLLLFFTLGGSVALLAGLGWLLWVVEGGGH